MLSRARANSAAALRLRRSCGPVAFDIVASGFGAKHDRIDHLLRYAAKPGDDGEAVPATLYLCNGATSALGAPPDAWPFPVSDAASFHRTYWSAQSSLALASDEQNGLWYMADLKTDECIVWMRDVDQLPEWEETAPLRHCFHWRAYSAGAVVAHTAAFSESDLCVLVTGPGGSGKSTLSVAALAEGFTVLSEDLCWIDLASGAPVARRLYDNIKISHASAHHFQSKGWFLPQAGEPAFAKAVLRLPHQASARGDIRALFCLSGSFAEQTVLKPCSKSMAYRLLAPSTVFLMRTAIAETSARLKNLVEMLPTFELTPSTDPATTVRALFELARTLP